MGQLLTVTVRVTKLRGQQPKNEEEDRKMMVIKTKKQPENPLNPVAVK